MIQLPISVILSPIFSRNLSSDDFAAVGYFNALAMFFTPLFNLSFYNYYMLMYSRDNAEKNKELLQTLTSFLILSNIILIGIAILILQYYLLLSKSLFELVPLGIVIIITCASSIGLGLWKINLRFERESFKYFILTSGKALAVSAISLLLIVW